MRKDLSGLKFTRLTVKHFVTPEQTKYPQRTHWLCVCDCGAEKIVPAHHLTNGGVQSCGCLNAEKQKDPSLKHRGKQVDSRKRSLVSVKERLPTNVKIDEDTFVHTEKVCRFIDDDFGEFNGTPLAVISGCKTHPARIKAAPKLIIGMDWKKLAIDTGIPYPSLIILKNKYGEEFAIESAYQYKDKDKLTSLEKFVVDTLGYERFDKMLVGRTRPDFKITDKVYLNADGLLYHSEVRCPEKNRHFDTRVAYEKEGLQLLQFYSSEICGFPHKIQSIVNSKVGNTNKIWARKTVIKKVSAPEAKQFLNDNHLMGACNGTGFGLYLGNELVCLLTVANWRKKGLEIVRFCNKLNITVVGGLGRLLSHVRQVYNPEKIFSWVDLRYGTGKSLETLGFVKKRDVLSWRWTDGAHTFHRLSCRANMDGRMLSEKEYATEKGWSKIYDAGQRLYEATCFSP